VILIEKRNIFTALQRNVNKENNEYLIDMLCMSGFNRDDECGFRALEPSRCCISSIALVLLKTGIVHHAVEPNGHRPLTVDYAQMATAQKCLLFWRKPAVYLLASLYFLSTLTDDGNIVVVREDIGGTKVATQTSERPGLQRNSSSNLSPDITDPRGSSIP